LTDRPALSIVIPAYDAATTIGATLISVFASAERTALDVVVVDDGSNDGAALREALAAYPDVRLIVHEHNRGMCAARNSGIAASRGGLVTKF
jgi:glycosyltransferase involved in cell wall biosynthesis